MNYRVVIVGAGPGGLVLARELAKSGIEVAIYEKGSFDELGHDWSDAVELISLQEAGLSMPTLDGTEWKGELVKDHQDGEGIFEKHAVPRLKICSPGLASSKEVDFKMITTDRRRLAKLLAAQAEEAGAAIYYHREGEKLLFQEKESNGPDSIEVYGVVINNPENMTSEEVNADLVVESSGFNSVLRCSLPAFTGLADPFKPGDFALVHREVRPYTPEKAAGGIIPDHYRYGYHTGYQWTHIHSETSIDVGAGVKNDPGNPDPRDIIEEFISRHPAIGINKLRGGRSLCIVGAPLKTFVSAGFFVIGDAASTSVPTTGCGAGSAILIALSAAKVIRQAALEERSDLEKLWEINTGFYLESDRGASFAALSALRVMLQTLNHSELDFLFKQDLMDAATLQDAVNGIFKPPSLQKKLAALVQGLQNIKVLLKLNRAISGAVNVYSHYRAYPAVWDKEHYAKWQAKADYLFSRIG